MRQYLLTGSEVKIIQMLRQIRGDVAKNQRPQTMTLTINQNGLEVSTAKTRKINTNLLTKQ